MTVLQKFDWSWPQGATPVSFDDWIENLPNDQKQECLSGVKSQHEIRQQAIDRGDMILTTQGYIWKDAETAQRGKGIDPVWEKYWLRWQKETQATFTMTYEEK